MRDLEPCDVWEELVAAGLVPDAAPWVHQPAEVRWRVERLTEALGLRCQWVCDSCGLADE